MLMLRHQLLCIRIIAVFFVYLLSFATLSAQEVRIVLSGTELPARDLFIQIERQTVYRFAYNSAIFDASQVINPSRGGTVPGGKFSTVSRKSPGLPVSYIRIWLSSVRIKKRFRLR